MLQAVRVEQGVGGGLGVVGLVEAAAGAVVYVVAPVGECSQISAIIAQRAIGDYSVAKGRCTTGCVKDGGAVETGAIGIG